MLADPEDLPTPRGRGSRGGPTPGAGTSSTAVGLGWEDLRSAYAEAPIGMAVLHLDGTVVSTNEALQTLLRRSEADLVGRSFLTITHPDDVDAARDRCASMTAGSSTLVRHECRFLTPAGGVQWVLVHTSRPAQAAGLPHLIMHIEDISDRKAFEEDLVRRALHDALTGLPNRVLLLDRLAHALRRGGRTTASTSLLFLDLDRFKQVNDAYGHAAGDTVLVQLAERLSATVRPGDTVGRLGGDEFVVLCESTDRAEAAALASRLREVAQVPFAVPGAGPGGVSLDAAIGIATAGPSDDGPGSRAEHLLDLADTEMYEHKRRRAARG